MARSPRTIATTIAAVAAVGVIATGIALGTGGDEPAVAPADPPAVAATSADSAEGSTERAVFSGPALPNVRASSTDGTVDFGELRGPALVHVYASWCSVCRAEAADLGRALSDAPAVKPVWIAVQDEPAASAAFADEFSWRSGPRIDDENRALAGRLGLTGQPNTILVDAEGNTRTFAGPVPAATLKALLRQMS